MSTPSPPDDANPAPPDAGGPAPTPSGWGDVPRYGQYGTGPAAPPTPYGGPAGQSPYRPPSDRPGIIPLRPLTMGEIYDGAFAAVRHNPAVMLGIATLVILIATLVGLVVGMALIPAVTNLVGPLFDDPALQDSGLTIGFTVGDLARTYALAAGNSLTFILAAPIVNGILTVSVSRSVLGERESVRQVWRRLGPRLWTLIGWSLLQTAALLVLVSAYTLAAAALVLAAWQQSLALAVALGILLTIGGLVVAVWLGTRLVLVPPALALESAGLWATVRRAWRLTRRSFWRLLGIYLLASIIVGVIAQVVAVPLGLLGSAIALSVGSSTAAVVATTVVTTVVSTSISTIFLAGVVALLYIDLRMRREGLDVALAAAAADKS
ncbi:glycerophosphoryl diester phosphodiesterase membrane domain-containing protein [Xylanimonas ulmi]|uniref:Glycerophosphoryl diester phosphodiesterase family protein n=1 Tax=Xylanimonas ulmi TaxID=228973 RepID=A0A4Q7LY10_9MICO|nr:glycerophosphoryl diester phosphodiesterase membrane domain-containing protein [Xylanibacterium ulmi]RZS60006.1 glycerophosphoryl diester phosphodiesterase family protein [Xylanibacterium ulmi]